jgi:phosphate transport system permease protein
VAVTTPDSVPAVRPVAEQLRGGRFDVAGIAFRLLLMASLLVTVAVLFVLLQDVLSTAWSVITGSLGDFLSNGRSSAAARSGVSDALKGTITIGIITAIVSFPLGIGAAIYLEEYAPKNRFNQLININIRNLAGVPSVVYGLLGLSIFVKLAQNATGGTSVLAAGLTMAVLVLPIVIITAAEAIRAVPASLSEGGYGIGMTRWEVMRRLVLPYAAPGILTGTVLALMRALGEAAPLIVVGAVTGLLNVPGSLLDQLQGKFTALPIYIFATTREPGDAFKANTAAAIVVLLMIVLVFNTAAILLRNHYEKKRT